MCDSGRSGVSRSESRILVCRPNPKIIRPSKSALRLWDRPQLRKPEGLHSRLTSFGDGNAKRSAAYARTLREAVFGPLPATQGNGYARTKSTVTKLIPERCSEIRHDVVHTRCNGASSYRMSEASECALVFTIDRRSPYLGLTTPERCETIQQTVMLPEAYNLKGDVNSVTPLMPFKLFY